LLSFFDLRIVYSIAVHTIFSKMFQTSEALSIGENMKDFLNRFYPEGKAFSPVESYGLVSGDNLDSFLESLRTNSMISRVSALYEDKNYETVQVLVHF